MNSVLIWLLAAALAGLAVRGFGTSKRIDLFTAPVLLSILFVFGYILPIRSFKEGSDVFTTSWPIEFYKIDNTINRAMFVLLIGVLGFYLGYFLVCRIKLPGSKSHSDTKVQLIWRRRWFKIIAIAYTSVGIGLFSIGVMLVGGPGVLLSGLGDRTRIFQGLNYFFTAINLLIVISLLWWSYILTNRTKNNFWFWIYLSMTMLMVSFQGRKSMLLIIILSMTVMYHILYKRIPALFVLLGGLCTASFLIIYAIFIREYLAQGEFYTLNQGESVYQVIAKGVGSNFFQIQTLAVLVDNVPYSLPYQHGKTFMSLITLAVPSAIWKDKPLPSTGIFTLAFWPEKWLERGTTLPPGLVGEMYMNFGTIGVFIGMLVFGWVYGYAFRRVYKSQLHPCAVILYALIIGLMPHYIRGEFVSPSVLYLTMAVPTVVASRLIVRQDKGYSLAFYEPR